MLQAIRKRSNLLRIKKHVVLKFAVAAVALFAVLSSFTEKEETGIPGKINAAVIANVSVIISRLDSIGVLFNADTLNRKECRKHYEAARKAYKEIEFYTEYQYPFHSKYYINAALVSKAEAEYNYKTFFPHGFQVLENIIYTDDVDSAANNKYELAILKQSFEYVKDKTRGKRFKSSTSVDMLRFELIRIMSLYLNGYDCTVNKQNLTETKSILDGFRKTIALFPGNEASQAKCIRLIAEANAYLSKNNDYDTFNRLYFIIHYLKPLYEELYTFYDREAQTEKTNYAVNIRQQKFYGPAWFNTGYFSVVLKDSNLVSRQAKLGELLFFDPLLSGNNQRACASCHQPEHAFAGNTDFSASFLPEEKLKRNTPSLVNAVFQKSFFYDGRSLQLEDQASDVLGNHAEMFSDPKDIVYKLKQSPDYKQLFKAAFGNTEDTAITYYGVLKSISEYERQMIALNSRFDNYLRGDEKQLTPDEIAGYTVFSGKALCGSCHFFPLFNGVPPPFYSDNEFEVIGVPKDTSNKEADPDTGRLAISKNKIHAGAFKTMGIRNIDKTAPYMHNGIYTTIDEVIDFYKKGGGAGLGLRIENQTLPFDSLQLTDLETANLKKFLLTLTDKTFHPVTPKKLPVVNIKGLEIRKAGGMY